MLEVANGKLMPRFALSLHYVSGTLNTALNGLLLVTRQIGQFCNIFFGCAVMMQRTIGEFQPSRPVISSVLASSLAGFLRRSGWMSMLKRGRCMTDSQLGIPNYDALSPAEVRYRTSRITVV